MNRRDFLRWAAASVLAGPAVLESCGRGDRKKTINFLNWSSYIGNETLSRFEQETGIGVNYSVYFSERELLDNRNFEAGEYDLAVVPDHLIPKLKASKRIVAIPHERLKNLDNIAQRFRTPTFDPELSYTVPYLWGTTGIGFNTARFPRPPDSWWALWDRRYRGRLSMLDNARETIQCALLLLGLPTGSADPAHLTKARDLLIRQRYLIKEYTSSNYTNELATGELWLAQAWSGDVLQAAQAKNLMNYAIPKEGSFIWLDNLCLLRDGLKDAVFRFVDYLLRPEIAADISNTVRYGTPNGKALPLLDPALRADPRAFPSPETEKRLRFSTPLDAAGDELWQETWEEIKAS